MKKFAVLLVAVACCMSASAATVYVSKNSPDDGPGTAWSNAFHTIQGGIDAAPDGYTVLVSNGTYVVAAPINLFKAVTLSGVGNATIDGGGTVRCVNLNHANAVIQGLTIRNGYTDSIGGGICVTGAGGTIRECCITGCRSEYGAGIMFVSESGLLDRCVVVSNRADVASQKQGGGVYIRTGVTMRNCLVTHNTARIGGGILSYYGGTVQGCTFSDNTATESGGGIITYLGGNYRNCISYFNSAPAGPNCYNLGSFSYTSCCITPNPGGTGNITDAPLFDDRPEGDYRLTAASPCVNAGNNADAGGAMDLDGHSRISDGTVDIGAYESGIYPVVYVAPGGSHSYPYTNWLTAATNIQSAVDAVAGGGSVWVSNGTYSVDATVTCDKSLSLLSLNGLGVTLINGQGSSRCISVAQTNVTVEGFTLTGGTATQGGGLYTTGTNTLITNCRIVSCDATEGGGVYIAAPGAVLEHCTLTNNTASSGNRRGGGLFAGEAATLRFCQIRGNNAEDGGGIYAQKSLVLENSLVVDNVADFQGGGMTLESDAQMANCTIARNSAYNGGGTCWQSTGSVANCILYDNSAFGTGTNYLLQAGGVDFISCCTWPAHAGGTGTILTSPQFFNPGAGDYHLGPNSPCIDAGENSAVAGSTDLDGLPRLSGTRVDIGVYEWASIHYVSLNGGHVVPFGSWATAATNIQEALDRCKAGDSIVVTDGTYTVSSQLSVTQAVTLASVNGAAATIIDAQQQCRCLLIGHTGAVIDGFTFKRGLVEGGQGGGICFAVAGGLVRRSIITECRAGLGLGVFFQSTGGILEDSTVCNNQSIGSDGSGGGVCIMVSGPIVRRCFITGNRASLGAGVFMERGGDLQDCVITGNDGYFGGGICSKYLYLPDTSYRNTRNCTIAWNNAFRGGGIYHHCRGRQRVFNSIVYSNTATEGPDYYLNTGTEGVVFFFTSWLPPAANPQFVSGGAGRLGPASPCINQGYNGYAPGTTDVVGHPRIAGGIVDVGAYERFCVHYVSPNGGHVFPYETWANAATNIQPALDEAHVAAQIFVTNGVYEGPLTIPRAIMLKSVNGQGTTTIRGVYPWPAPTPCLTLNAAATVDGFTFENQTTNLGVGISVSAPGSTIKNCTVRQFTADEGAGVYYASGTGVVENCTIQNNTATGGAGQGGGIYARPGVEISDTTIEGNQSLNGGGVYLYQGGALRQCRVTTNDAVTGGGAYLYQGGTVERCVVATNSADAGGGIYAFQSGTVVNSLITSNSAQNGGGAYFNFGGILRNCTLLGNSATADGGGLVSKSGTLIENDILWGNSVGGNGTNWFNVGTGMTYDHCCTLPDPGGNGHVTQAPAFMADGRHLLYGSSCVDAGKDLSGVVINDFDNGTRPVDGNFDSVADFDIGAYEYDPLIADSNMDGIPDGWYHGYGLNPVNPSEATLNPDSDPFTSGEEFIADTDPTNSKDWFRITAISNLPPVTVYFQSSSNRLYTMNGCSNLVEGVWNPVPGTPPRMGVGGADSMTFSNNLPAEFYKFTVELP